MVVMLDWFPEGRLGVGTRKRKRGEEEEKDVNDTVLSHIHWGLHSKRSLCREAVITFLRTVSHSIACGDTMRRCFIE